jgi:neutral ceramidase
MKVAFAEIDITPPLGTAKIGWLKNIVPARVLDPLFARATILESGRNRLAFISLDTLFVRAEETSAIRMGVEHRYGFPGANLMVAATHNHGGPAVAECGDVRPDENYCHTMIERCVTLFGQALEKMQEAQFAFASKAVFGVAHNRRVIQRSGIVKTHATFDDPNSLCLEGPVDPQLAVLALRRPAGDWLGAIVNYALHPTHHGGDDTFSAGWPGVLAQKLKANGCPCVFLNGAYGNIATSNPTRSGKALSMEETGSALAEHVVQLLQGIKPECFRAEATLVSHAQRVQLPYRDPTPDQIKGTVRGAQRFIDPAIYDRNIPRLVEQIRASDGTLFTEVQAHSVGDICYVGVPCEWFVEFGLQLKERLYPRQALVVGSANDIVGYVPHAAAFARGGYETTFLSSSKLALGAGDMLLDIAVKLAGKK